MLLRVLAGVEHCSRISQGCLNRHRERMRATKHAPRGLFRVFERRHGLAEIVDRGAGVLVERPCVPRHVEDPAYAYRRLKGVLENMNISKSDFIRGHRSTFHANFVHSNHTTLASTSS